MIVVPAERIADFKKKGWWSETRIDDLFEKNVREKTDREACIDPINCMDIVGREPRRLSWWQLEDLVSRYTAVFTSHGLRKDDALVVQLPNTVDLPAVYLACARLGIIVSPAPVQYREHELGYISESIDAKAALTATRIGKHAHGEMLVRVKAEQPKLQHVFVLGDAVEGATQIEPLLAKVKQSELAAAQRAEQEANVSADDIVTICWTSGTEAKPKGVPRSHNEWIIMGEGVVHAGDIEDGDHLLNPFPMVNMAGISTSFVSWLLVGGKLVQHQPFDLQVFLKQIRDEKIDYTVAPPAILNLLLQNEALLQGIDFGRLQNIGSGSAPLSEWMVDTFHKKHGVQITNFFGSNEGASFPSTYRDVPDPAQRAAYFPRFGEGFAWDSKLHDRIFTRLVDPDTEEVVTEAGKPGELRVKGATIFSGYWRAPEINARAFDADGWFRTGDLFELAGDRHQFYRFVGRYKDIIIRGGMNISSEEIEGHLVGHPSVADVAVVGAPDQTLGERLCAFVVFKPGQSADMAEINRYLTQEKKIAVFKQIERLEPIDALPRNPVGKILKRELREKLQQEA